MDELQRRHERAVGDRFVDWYNGQHGTAFVFGRRPKIAPDLVYKSDEAELPLEIGDAYYDPNDAKIKWLRARKKPNAPRMWTGSNPDRNLLQSINRLIRKKCARKYGAHCLLVVNVYPALTSADEIEAMLPEIHIPEANNFEGVYLTGDFPASNKVVGGFRCWQIAQV